MANAFLISTKKLITQHALDCDYLSVSTGTYDPALSAVTNTTTTYAITAYPKQVIANSYNYPNLIGKQIIEFYLINESLGFTPKVNDIIEYDSVQYVVTVLRSFTANKEVILYKLLSVAS